MNIIELYFLILLLILYFTVNFVSFFKRLFKLNYRDDNTDDAGYRVIIIGLGSAIVIVLTLLGTRFTLFPNQSVIYKSIVEKHIFYDKRDSFKVDSAIDKLTDILNPYKKGKIILSSGYLYEKDNKDAEVKINHSLERIYFEDEFHLLPLTNYGFKITIQGKQPKTFRKTETEEMKYYILLEEYNILTKSKDYMNYYYN